MGLGMGVEGVERERPWWHADMGLVRREGTHTVLEGKEITVQMLHQEGPGREGWGNPKPTKC